MARSVAIIGAGQIGYAAVEQFLFKGWDVRLLARSQPEWSFQGVQFEHYETRTSSPPKADVVIDTIAFDQSDLSKYDPGDVGRLIVVSSASVYCDSEGRTLDEAAQNGFPEFDGPITEFQQTVAPGPQTYSTRKVRMENEARRLFGDRATILRPCAVHGAWSRHPREWWFVKRMLDARTQIPLALKGESQFHTTAAKMIGHFAQHAGASEVGGTFNLGDADWPTVLDIGQTIADNLRKKVEFVPIDGFPQDAVGRTPWSVPLPFIVSSKAAFAAGLDDDDYYDSALECSDWLEFDPPTDWRAAFPQLAAYPWDLFDYEAEDRFLASL